MAILTPIEFTATTDGQSYNAVFEHFFTESPNRCEIFLNGCKVGDATWYHDDGLIDRQPDHHLCPVKAWEEVCEEIEKAVEYRIDGHKRAMACPTFRTSQDELLHYKEGQWVGEKRTFGARLITGYPVDDDDTVVEGTFVHS